MTTDELFEQLEKNKELYLTSEEYCMLESDTSRVVVVPARYTVFGVEEDTNVERVLFKFPKIVGDKVDLTTLNLRVNYMNALEETDRYLVDDVKETDDGYITFSWQIKSGLTPEMGQISFIVQAIKTESDGTIQKKWSTTVNKVGQVLEGLEVSETDEEKEKARDLLTQLLSEMEIKKDDLNKEIEAKGQETLESIPDDYYNLAGQSYKNLGVWDYTKLLKEAEQNTVYFVSMNDPPQLPNDVPTLENGKTVGPGWIRTSGVGFDDSGNKLKSQEYITWKSPYRKYNYLFLRTTNLEGEYSEWSLVGKQSESLYDYIIKSWRIQNYKISEENGYYYQGVWVQEEGWYSAKIPISIKNKYIIGKLNVFIDLYKGNEYISTLSPDPFSFEIIPDSYGTFYRYFIPDSIDYDHIYLPYQTPDEKYFLYTTPFDHPTMFFDKLNLEDEIVVSGGRIVNKEQVDHLEESDVFNGVMNFYGGRSENITYVSTKLLFFKKGTVIDTKNTGLDFDIRGTYKGSEVLYVTKEEANKHYEFTDDAYVSINAQYKGANWPDNEPEIDILERRCFIRILPIEERNKNPWKGKVWWAYGTSITDIGPNDTTGNNGHSGKYPLSLEAFSELQRNNGAIGSGGILDDKPDNLNYRKKILQTPYETDIVTIETLPNDDYTNHLGEIGDTEGDTIVGALTQCFEYLTTKTRARVVLLIVTGSIHAIGSETPEENYKPYETVRTNWRKAVEKITELANLYGVTVIDADANALDWGRRKTGITYKDHIHLNYLGGEIFGSYIWNKLKHIKPYVEK